MAASRRIPVSGPGWVALLAVALASGPGCEGGSNVAPADDAAAGDVSEVPDAPPTDVPGDIETAEDDVPRDVPGGDADIPPGSFGAPCNENGDCDSGFCIEGPDGFFCTQICVENCPEGFLCRTFFLGGEPIALCVFDFVKGCSPCRTDAQCNGGRCLQIEGSGRCVAPCQPDRSCVNSHYECLDVEADEGQPAAALCMPKTGSCSCLEDAQEGQVRSCSVTNDDGTCYGVETCNIQAGWEGCSAATPAPETCNGLDENCNGRIDEGLPETLPCESTVAGVGTCTGLSRCTGVLGWVCDARTPAFETCNGQDDDCDGETDDGFATAGVYDTLENCGACGLSCVGTIPNAVEACDPAGEDGPHCVVASCDTGYLEVDQTHCYSLATTLCLPCDEDGDCVTGHCQPVGGGSYCTAPCEAGQVVEGYDCQAVGDAGNFWAPSSGACGCEPKSAGQRRPCYRTGAGATCYGFETCDPATGWVDCTAPVPAEETCNGLDDDCDGWVDEDLSTGEACTVEVPGVGTCQGIRVCLGPQGETCTAARPAPESCNYVDDDCDGETDEGFATGGEYLADSDCGVCGNVCGTAIAHGTGTCQDGAQGPRCVVATCDPGYYPVNGVACLGVSDVVCSPCSTDAQCMGGTCRTIGDGDYCTRTCDAGRPCPAGTTCTATGGEDLCLPDTGACTCTPANAGAVRLCHVSGEAGTCYGTETCEPDQGGYVGCNAATPAAETCNGSDDDCDGQVDEDVPPTRPCSNVVDGVGTCLGTATCSGAAGYVCHAPMPAAEACDFLDNDCDGLTDEDFLVTDPGTGEARYGTVENCGTCGTDCADQIRNATPACDLSGAVPRCVVDHCDPGYYRLSDYQCILPPLMTCQPCDSDAQCFGNYCTLMDGRTFCLAPCDQAGATCGEGTTCKVADDGRAACFPLLGSCDCGPDEAGSRRACSRSNAYGSCLGFQTCDPASGWSACDALVPAPESCDGIDNDCDGAVDEGFTNKGKSCWTGLGECYATGVLACTADGTGTACDAVAGAPTPEVCDDLDNDCDGLVDQDFPEKGRVCLAGTGECRRSGTNHCLPDGSGVECDATEGPASPETCDLLDNDCDGLTDEDFKGTQGGMGYDRVDACGNCFNDCARIYTTGAPMFAVARCVATGNPTCGFTCEEGHADADGNPENGCELFLDPLAIYVSTPANGGKDGETCGDFGAPCAGIGTGIARARVAGRDKVLVSSGLYPGSITLAAGIAVKGGHNAITWRQDPPVNVTVIQGQDFTPEAPGAVNAFSIAGAAGGTLLEGFTILGRNNPAIGASSYAVYLRDCTDALVLSNNVVEGGIGGAGTKGVDGPNGPIGIDGTAGGASYGALTTNCSALVPAVPRAGGAGGSQTCNQGVVVSGGGGGGNTCPPVYNQAPVAYENGSNGSGPLAGTGGAGGYDREAWVCSSFPPDGECHQPSAGNEVGNRGLQGGDGGNGSTAGTNGCVAAGRVEGGLWTSGNGLPGADGAPGSGGGGGGAGGGARNGSGCSSRTQIGGAGGGGGSGGCGGEGGLGGGSGGGSFGVFLVWSQVPTTVPTLVGNTIRGGMGGFGGSGGNGGSGGPGGAGGDGGAYDFATAKCAAPGGDGGNGGNGGHGEGGGGGCGGVSYAIHASGNGTVDLGPYAALNTLVVGFPGLGGSGGPSIGTPGDAGADGAAWAANF